MHPGYENTATHMSLRMSLSAGVPAYHSTKRKADHPDGDPTSSLNECVPLKIAILILVITNAAHGAC
jgi:hypothetical protein